jgi:xanthine dehydrogenase large subunit
MRGFGAPQGMLVVEQALDLAAALLGLDPLEIRRRNLYGEAPRDRTPYGDLVPDCRLGRMIDELARDVDLDARHLAVAAFNERNPWLKRGLALTPVKFGISFTQTFLNQAGALVLLYEDGSVQLNHGGTEMGQGLYTKMTQVCAHALGVPREAVRSMPTSTDKVPNTSPTAASSGADLNGQAVRDACETLVARLRPVAANLLGVTPEDAVLGTDHRAGSGPTLPDGASAWAWREDGTRGVSFTQVCHAARFQRVSLSATGYYRTPGILYDRKAGQGRPFHYFAYGVALAEVELNGLSGEWRVLRVEILHDVGDSLSPALDRGQIEGGFVQGLGWLSTEELRWSPRGELLTRGPSTYKIPAVGDVPLDFKVTLLQAATQPETIHGSKAVGEPPLTLAISAWQAVCRAASAFGPPGTHVRVSLPATPEAALEAVELARSRAHAGGDAAPTAR